MKTVNITIPVRPGDIKPGVNIQSDCALVYDATLGCFRVTTAAQLFSTLERKQRESDERIDAKIAELDAKYREFTKSYAESMGKLVAMVEAISKGE